MAKKFPCPKCGTEVPVGQNFCTGCGEKFEYRAPGEAAPPQAPPAIIPTNAYPLMEPPAQHQGHSGLWIFLGTVGAILCIGVVFLLVAMGSGTDSGASSGGFSFKELLPGPSLPPPTIKPAPEDVTVTGNTDEVTGSSRYSKEQVIAVAKRVSPECRRDKYG